MLKYKFLIIIIWMIYNFDIWLINYIKLIKLITIDCLTGLQIKILIIHLAKLNYKIIIMQKKTSEKLNIVYRKYL